MGRQTALLASGGGAFWNALREELEKNNRWCVKSAADMDAALAALEDEPELLIADLVLGGGDGTALIAKKPVQTHAMAVSYIKDGLFYALAVDAGAQDCVALPAPAPCVARRACAMLHRARQPQTRNAAYAPQRNGLGFEQAQQCAARFLLELSLPVTMDGYRYLCFAAAVCACDETLMRSVTTRLYPMVAQAFSSTPARVERSMRYAVERVFDKADVAVLHRAFGYSADPCKGKLSVGAFVAQLVYLMDTTSTLHIGYMG